jgi:hypothetical protein
MLIAGLGITADGLERALRIRCPSLPRQVGRVYVGHLRVGDAHVDLLFERVAHRTERVALTDVKINGQLDVVLEILRAPGHKPRARDPLDPLGSGTKPQTTSAPSS